MSPPIRIPYTQQFSRESTPLGKLIGVLRQHQGKRDKLRQAVASAFFSGKKDADGLAGNTLISLKVHGLIDENAALTEIGRRSQIRSQIKPPLSSPATSS